MSNNAKNPVVVITGAARGLGLAMARRFGREGAQLVITDVNETGGQAAAASLRQEGMLAEYATLDVRDPAQSAALVPRLAGRFGRIDVWVNNAGVSHIAPAESLSLQDWDESLAVMLSGVFYCSQAVGRQMLAQGQGVIVNVSSSSGIQYIEGRSAYSVPKAGLIMLTQALGIEWARRGVRVVGIAPGVVMTEMFAQGLREGIGTLDAYTRRTPMRRLGTEEEIAEAVYWLASDEASYVVAETLRVDGGWTAYDMF